MPVLSVRHVTTYRYRQAVAFGDHRMMFWPIEGHDQRILDQTLRITPEPLRVDMVHDVFSNTVGVARFSGRARELCFESEIVLAHEPADVRDFMIEEQARSYPFAYDASDMPDLLRSIERAYPDEGRAVDEWARSFLRKGEQTDTRTLLVSMNAAIHERFVYIRRDAGGTQSPAHTLHQGSGTCRDFAVLMMDALRSLGFATHFVSGYLYSPPTRGHSGGGATHAWVRVYLPGAGWVEFDPTNGIVGNRDLIRVAVARDPRHAVPLSGTYTGFPADHEEMHVEVNVRAEPETLWPTASVIAASR